MDGIINESYEIVVALGSNQPSHAGSSQKTVEAAFSALEAAGLTLRKKSRFFATPAFPAGIGPDYVNAAVACETVLPPKDVLAVLHKIEADFGRERVQRWGNRTLDLDLIFYGDVILPDLSTWQHWASLPPEAQKGSTPEELLLPHPRLADRAFVLVPMAEVAAHWTHPVSGLSVPAMLALRPASELDEIKAL